MPATRSLAAAALAGLFGVAAAADPPAPKEGDKAPDIKLAAASGIETVLPGKKASDTVSLHDLGANGKNVVVFFFPKALTGG